MIIGISGKLNSGKDTVAQIINFLSIGGFNSYYNFEDFSEFYTDGIDEYPFKTVRFADKLKDCACLILGCTREQIENREFKEKELGEEWWKYELSWHEHTKVDCVYNTYEEACEELRNFGGSSFDEKEAITTIKLTPRLLLQLLGTECGRQIIHPNIWVNATMADYNPDKKWIIPDVRFKNEADSIKEKSGLLIRINRPCTTCKQYNNVFCSNPYHVSNHQSEIDLDNYGKFDYIIDNNGTIEDLLEKVEEILIKEKL